MVETGARIVVLGAGTMGAGIAQCLADHGRDVTLTDPTVTTWNLYPWGEAHVRIHDSLLGEILSEGDSKAYVTGSVIDGSGGYLGAKENSTMTLYDTIVTTAQSVSVGGVSPGVRPPG